MMGIVGMSTACSSQKAADADSPITKPIVGVRNNSFIPKGLLYTTNGNYNSLVAITLNESRTQVMSYPAPTDVSEASAPLIIDGYLLDRRGAISFNTAFISMTYTEYSRLPQAPSQSELLKMVIPEARVTELITLPIPAFQAISQPAEVARIISGGLKDCRVVKP